MPTERECVGSDCRLPIFDFSIQPTEKLSRHRATPVMQDTKTSDKFDLTVYFLIVALGILQFLLGPRSADYLRDTNYFELANSVIHKASYGFNGKQ